MNIIKTILLWIFVAVCASGGMYIGYLLFSDNSSNAEQSEGSTLVAGDSASAVALCETAIKQFSLNASKVDLPLSEPIDNGESWRILWIQDKRIKLQNVSGAMIDTNVVCNVRKSDGVVDELLIDGEKIMGKI